MMSFDISTLNEQQITPCKQLNGAIMVTAGAGSGKTRLLTHRIAYMIESCGISPANILAITFTNKAANEMRERLEKMVNTDGLWVSTFHSLCVRILRSGIDKLGYNRNFTIYAEPEKEKIIKLALKELSIDDGEILKLCKYAISDAKTYGKSPDKYYIEHKGQDNCETVFKVFAKYEEKLKSANALDFDDLLVKAEELLRTDSDSREYYQNKFHYIHVDEFQDTNIIQYDLVKILAGKHKNIFVVGDEDQCIYGWRGANIGNIYDFRKDFPNTVDYKLDRNYRSTKNILEIANKVIVNNKERLDKNLWTDHDDGEKVVYYSANSDFDEAEFVVSTISKLIKYEKYKYSDFAILMRINATSRLFEERLISYGMPHIIFGGFKFFERKEIKDIMAYMRVVVNPDDLEAILRAISFPKRGIGETTIANLMQLSRDYNVSLRDIILNIEMYPVTTAVLMKVKGFADILKQLIATKGTLSLTDWLLSLAKLIDLKTLYKDKTDENLERKQNIEELVSAIESYEKKNVGATLENFLEYATLFSDAGDNKDKNVVTIATVHSAKGLEFPVVFVIGLEEGLFPSLRSSSDISSLEEERRLMYVAVTRAMERLYLTRAKLRMTYGKTTATTASKFLKEAGLVTEEPYRSQDNYSYNKTNFGSEERDINYNKNFTPKQTVTLKQQPSPQPIESQDFEVGDVVRHKKFGKGIILSISGDGLSKYAEIKFDVSVMTLALGYAPLTKEK